MENSAAARVVSVASSHPAALSTGVATTSGSDCTALDSLAFDSSLSFLAEADAKPVPSQVLVTSPTLQKPAPSDDDGRADTALAEDMLALVTEEDSESEPIAGSSPDGTTPADEGSDASSSPPPPTLLTPQPPPKRAYATSRVRQKQEIAYLRVQVAELESELAVIAQNAEAEQATSEAAAPSAWKNIAQHQLGEKLRAERENATLCSLLEGQLRVARSLERLLRKRVLSETDALFVERKRPRGSAATLDLEMAVNEIRARITHQFATVDTMMEDCGLARVTTARDDARATCDATNRICMELTTVKVYPFSLVEVTDALWAYIRGGSVLPDQAPASQTELEFNVPLHVRRSEARVHLRGVCARRMAAHRTVIVFENVGVLDGSLVAGQEINCREHGCVVVEQGVPSRIGPTTIVKACARMWPEAAAAGAESPRTREVGLFSDLVLGFYNQHSQHMLQTVENLLLSRSAGKGSA